MQNGSELSEAVKQIKSLLETNAIEVAQRVAREIIAETMPKARIPEESAREAHGINQRRNCGDCWICGKNKACSLDHAVDRQCVDVKELLPVCRSCNSSLGSPQSKRRSAEFRHALNAWQYIVDLDRKSRKLF